MARKTRKSTPSLFDIPDVSDPPSRAVSAPPPTGGSTDGVALHEAAQSRYLNYALSVITSRALPDVRDGLKPVQRRILYTMWQQNLTADAKHRKCAKVVGDVMGSYHPHGDAALYETLVRMAQSFSLRYPLIDGSGNFGSLDGDSAAAMRYTECRLARIADEMLSEIDQRTVPFRPNYDGTKTEPVVLPARIPNLLVNGTTGIAVGMATNVPPHNLGEVCTALLKLRTTRSLSSAQLCRYVKGPDFPTGGQILNSADELKEIYRTGSGTVRLRATWEEGPQSRASRTLYVTSIPYTVNKAALVERIADVVLSRKLPPLLDVKDVSTDDVRIALELKKEADPQMVMAYLFKNTPLQTNVIVNLTALVPTENAEVGRPERCDLHSILWHFLHFRLEVVTRRLEHELEGLRKRIHVLEGFEKVFDALDEIIRIIRKSDGKADSAEKIMKRFEPRRRADRRHSRVEAVSAGPPRDPRHPERAEPTSGSAPGRLTALLKDEDGAQEARSRRDRGDAKDLRRQAADAHRGGRGGRLHRRRLHRRGRQRRDRLARRVGEAAEGSARPLRRRGCAKGTPCWRCCRAARAPAWCSSPTSARPTRRASSTSRIDRLRRTGPEAVQAARRRARRLPRSASIRGSWATSPHARKARRRPVHALAVTSDGYSLRFSLEPFVEPSTRAGRRYARPAEGVEVVGVSKMTGRRSSSPPRSDARAILCRADEINYLSGPGKGVILIKLQSEDDRVLGFMASIERSRPDARRNEPRRRADDQHGQVRGDRARWQGPRAAAARPVHARDSQRRGELRRPCPRRSSILRAPLAQATKRAIAALTTGISCAAFCRASHPGLGRIGGKTHESNRHTKYTGLPCSSISTTSRSA